MRLVLATGNAGKLRELRELLPAPAFEVRALSDFTRTAAEETGLTFVENAILKARHAAAASGLPAIADDSGLEVDALGGAPGIYSARYAGDHASDEDNLHKLLEALAGLPDDQRTARYRCALVFMRSAEDASPLIVQTRWEGRIVATPSGEGGFGYDPIFRLLDRPLTVAQLPAQEKNQLSHRGRALRELVTALQAGAAGPVG